jgi:serine/threonine-protein kinase
MTVGTVAYAAPEQLMGEQLDGRADQYALAATAFHLLTGTPLFQHSNPAVVISQHLSTPPPAIGTRRPALADLGPVLSKALAKTPAERYDTCMGFATALAHRLGDVASETGAADATVSVPAVKGPKHRSRPAMPVAEKQSRRRQMVIGAIALAVLLGVVAAAALWWTSRDRHSTQPEPPQAGHAPSSPGPGGPPSIKPGVPVVLIGADCGTLGQVGVSSTGAQAYCAKLSSTGDAVWSLVPDPTLDSTVTPEPTDEVYPPGIEEQVRLCVQQTGQNRLRCRADIRNGNIYGPA